ncbi:probable methyltransferase-like protein 24 [Haliotis rubra]|uniref:probable methyltransferase-like protein 24 n=1 Tax=Haliotis rubra TaxID=36100 RepID=UPI001EE5AE7D|nr:probable methyltransferase-like protein 24 [Haliotis rubra]
MAVGSRAVVTALAGAALLAVVVLYTSRDQIGYTKNTIMRMISSEGTGRNPPEYTCSKIERKGSWHICNDGTFNVKPPCLVYSFGIWKDWSFDDAMGNVGCEVHSFDPSIGKASFNRSKNVHFHDLGLSGKDSDTYVPTKDIYVNKTTTWKIRRLKTIMEMLGHTKRHLDILKIDIETSEWPAVKDIAASGLFSKVRQFAVEWHLFPTYPNKSEYIGFYAGVIAMKKQGLRTFREKFKSRNYAEKTFHLQADVNYVNMLYKGI